MPAFGPQYLIPRPFDPRLILSIAPAVAKAAMDSGVATRPIADFDAYREQLKRFVYHSGGFMKPIFAAAKQTESRRIVYAEGEEERVLRAVQVIVDEQLARPILIARPAVLQKRIEKFGLRIRPGRRLRSRQSGMGRALSHLLAGVPAADGPPAASPSSSPRSRCAGA